MSPRLNAPLWKNLPGMLSRPERQPFPDVIGTFMARDALSLAATHLRLGPDDVVLLPAYLCKEVLRPFAGRTRVEFYDIGRDLTVDPAALDRVFRAVRVRLLVIINYFGFLQPFRRDIADLCARYGITLLEDCAHSLLTDGSGQTGDLAVFSFRKTLPVADGGGLTIREPESAVAIAFHPRLYSNVLSALALMKSLLNVRNETLSRAGMSRRGTATRGSSTPTSHGPRRVLPISTFSSNGIGHVSFPDVVARRRADYVLWDAFARNTGALTPVFPEFGAGVCPLGFPVRVADRDAVKTNLEARGVAVKIHWRLPEGIDERFVNSHRLSDEIMTLPVYPDLDGRTRVQLLNFVSRSHAA